VGIKLARSTTGPSFESWIPGKGNGKQFQFSQAKPRAALGSAGGAEKTSKTLFLAEKWNWVTEPEGTPRP
jgi:hypothetical protein